MRWTWLGLAALGCGAPVVDEDGDGVPAGVDCDDRDPRRGAPSREVCNGLDDDCDGLIDAWDPDLDPEGATITWYRDFDGDGFGVLSQAGRWCTPPDGRFSAVAGDCDDYDPTRSPGAPEVCNGVDDDCDGRVDDDDDDLVLASGRPFYEDRDGDGFGAGPPVYRCAPAPGLVAQDGDCDDDDPARHPGADEVCNGVDDDCDGRVDDADRGLVGAPTWRRDRDGDGFGGGPPIAACARPEASFSTDEPEDCDDRDPDVHPMQLDDACDGVDRDCSGPDVWVPDDAPSIVAAASRAPDFAAVCVRPGTWTTLPSQLRGPVVGVGGSEVTRLTSLGQHTIAPLRASIRGFTVERMQGGIVHDQGDLVLDDLVVEHLSPPGSAQECRGLLLRSTGQRLELRDVEVGALDCAREGARGTAVWAEVSHLEVAGLHVAEAKIETSGTCVSPLLRLTGAQRAHVQDVTVQDATIRCGDALSGVPFGGAVAVASARPSVDGVVVAGLRVGVARGDVNGGAVAVSTANGGSIAGVHVLDAQLTVGGAVRGGGLHVATSPSTARPTVRHLLVAGVSLRGDVAPGGVGAWVPGGTSVEQATFVQLGGWAAAAGARGVAVYFQGPGGGVVNAIAAHVGAHAGDTLWAGSDGHAVPGITWTATWDVAGTAYPLPGMRGPGVVTLEPGFVAFDPTTPPTTWDLALAPWSPLRDAGHPGQVDRDGTRSDPGHLGGR